MESKRPSDEDVIRAQIGRRPRGLRGVPVRCSYGYPQIIRVSPLVDGAPFPTLFWLSCPYLGKAVDRLEADGWVGHLEQRMANDVELGAEMAAAHDRYVALRAAELSSAERIVVESSGMAESLLERGIGGIADRRRLKCLHLHVAHALADANPIGEIVLEMLRERECDVEQGICSALVEGGADRTARIDR
jgi:hypothetical protein